MARLEQLLYSSTATGRTDSLVNMAKILAESHRNNLRDGLTGALAAHQGCYLQVIEGPADVLDSLLRRLESDPRHRHVTLIDREPITQRLFGDWTMANARITPGLESALEALIHGPTVDPAATVTMLRQASQPA